MAADQTRGGMTTEVVGSLFSLLLNYFPYSDKIEDEGKIIQLSKQCGNIAFSIVYDATIYLKNLNIAMYGLTILKFIYKKGQQQKIKELIIIVNKTYIEIERNLKRPERNDLKDALQLVREFKSDLKGGSLAFPVLSKNLMKQIYSSREKVQNH